MNGVVQTERTNSSVRYSLIVLVFAVQFDQNGVRAREKGAGRQWQCALKTVQHDQHQEEGQKLSTQERIHDAAEDICRVVAERKHSAADYRSEPNCEM